MGAVRFRRTVFAAALAALAATGLSACMPQAGESTPTATASSAPAEPTPTPTVTAAPAARILVTAQSVSVLTQDGDALTTFDYRQLTSEVVKGLSAFLGEPSEVPFPSTSHLGEGTRYEWDAFSVSSENRWATLPDEELPDYLARWTVRASAPTARGISVETVDGIRVGDPTTEVLERYPDAGQRTEGESITSRYDIFLGAVLPPIPEDSPDYNAEYRWQVWLFDEDPTDVLQDLRAPSPNFGA
ncbi:hypothetical protein [Naasia sp. SYSU D00057]|uniref:hypothetical protein n=1 Tax=Naasia sp. SYSU D00057 TaxID=2817380 RepID=UPI001B302B88|nr:hypothetical protein [Naasia sp. SYSU D00057]